MPYMTGAEYARSRRRANPDEAKRTAESFAEAVLAPGGPRGVTPRGTLDRDRGGGHSVFGRPNNLNGW